MLQTTTVSARVGLKTIEIHRYSPSAFERGTFLTEEWTSFSDVADGKVSKEEYLRVERMYVAAITHVASQYESLEARNVEHWELDSVASETGCLSRPDEGERIERARWAAVARRCLREEAWLELGRRNELLIHFGYDLRLVVMSAGDLSEPVRAIRNDGLFVYDFRSSLASEQVWFEQPDWRNL